MAFAKSGTVSLTAAAALIGACWLLSGEPGRAQDATPEVQTIDAMNKLFGKHPGTRANHAKGVMLEGTFTASPDAASLSRAAFLQPGAPVPILVRFSDATGLPDLPDGAGGANPHGMAVRFHQADGTDIDVVNNSLKLFPVRTIEDFRDLLLAVGASPDGAPKPTKLDTFLGAHPAAGKAFGSTSTPASLAVESYQGINAFILTDKDGKTHAVRTRIMPASGVTVHLPPEEAAKLPPNYLMDGIVSRVLQGPVLFRLQAQLAEPGDPTNDATVAWPDTRKVVELGTIALTKPVANSAEAAKAIVFFPTNLTDGIEPSDDPLIASRTAAYTESFARRQ